MDQDALIDPPKKKTTQGPDLYPEITEYKLDPKLSGVLRQNGRNPSQLQTELDTVLKSGDTQRKATLLQQYASLSDRVNGNNAATSFLTSRQAMLGSEQQAEGSVTKTQAFLGSVGNGLTDLVESVPKLVVAAYQGVKGNQKEWERANKSIEDFFSPLRTYVSQDYQQGLASYDPENGLDLHLDAKSLVGTVGQLAGFMLPGLITAGAGSLATMGARTALRGATVAADIANYSAKLSRAGKVVKGLTGAESMLQTFPGYQKEAMDAGFDIRDATLFALPVAAINGLIETANVGALTKALGMGDDAARQAIRTVSQQEVRKALQDLTGKTLTRDSFLEAAQTATKNTLGVITRPKEMGLLARLGKATGRRLAQGLEEQGLAEGGEEFFQTTVEQVAKLVANNYGASRNQLDEGGRFKDVSLGNYVFNSVYGTLLGVVAGTSMGSVFQQRKLNPTIFGQINADVRLQMAEGLSLDEIVPKLKMTKQVTGAFDEGTIDKEGYDDLMQKVGRMAETAHEFADVEGFTDSDRYLMFNMSQVRDSEQVDASGLADIKNEYLQLTQELAAPGITAGQRLKGELRKNELLKQLGGPMTDEAGQPVPDTFQAEQYLADRSQAFESIAEQTLSQYAAGTDRKAIKGFFDNNYIAWQKQYKQMPAYEDSFTPQQVAVDPQSGETIAFDSGRNFFRIVTPTGGEVSTPMSVNEEGKFVPSIRTALDYQYDRPVDSIDRHLALTDSLADPSNPIAQSVEPYIAADNSPERNWIRDGEDLLQQLNTTDEEGKFIEPTADQKNMVTAYLTDSSFLAENSPYADLYNPIAEQLQRFVSITPEGESAEQKADDTDSNTDSAGKALVGDMTVQAWDTFVDLGRLPIDEEESILTGIVEAIKTGAPLSERQQVIYQGYAEQIENQLKTAGDVASPDNANKSSSVTSSSNGEATQTADAGNIQSTPSEPSTPDAQYSEQLQSIVDWESAAQAEAELEQVLADIEASGAEPSVEQLGRLADALDKVARIKTEATDSTGTGSGEQSADQGDVTPAPVAGTLRELWPALSEEQRQEATSLAQQYLAGYDGGNLSALEQAIYRTMPRIRDLKNGFARFGDANNFTRSLAKSYAARASETTAPYLDQYVTELQETFPDATEQSVLDFMLKFPTGKGEVKTYGLKGIADAFIAITGKTLNSLVAQKVIGWQTETVGDVVIPDDVDLFDSSALDLGVEILFNLTTEDADALDALFPYYFEQAGNNWLTSLVQDLDNTFPPVSDQLRKRLEQLTSGENLEAYERVKQSLESQFLEPEIGSGNGQSESGALEQTAEDERVSDGISDGAEEAGSQSGEPSAAASPSAGPAEDLIESAIQSLESAGADEGIVAEPVLVEPTLIDVSDDEYRAFRADPATYPLSEELKQSVGWRLSNNAASNRDLVINQNRGQEISPYVVAANQAKTEARRRQQQAEALLKQINDSISAETSQDARTAEVVAPLDIELANLTLQRQQSSEDLGDEESSTMAEDIVAELDLLDAQRQALIEQKIAVATEQTTPAQAETTEPAEQKTPATIPDFQLQPAPDINPSATQALATLISQSTGVGVVADPAEYERVLAESGALAELGDERPLGFAYNNQVYLSPDASDNTVLHEFGHIWTNVARTAQPELYEQGLSLVADSEYMDRVLSHPYYSTLSPEQQLDEALAMAIGDEGVQLPSLSEKGSFGKWLQNLWQRIKELLGLAENPEQMTLRDFVQQVVGQLTSGQPLDTGATSPEGVDQAQGEVSSAQGIPQFQLPAGVPIQTMVDLQASARAMLESVPVVNIGAGVSPNVWDLPRAEWSKADKEYIKEVKQQTGFELTDPQTFAYTKPANLYHLPDGNVARLDGYQLAQVLQDGFVRTYEEKNNRGRVFQFMFSKMRHLANLETFIGWLDNAEGVVSTLLKDIKRTTAQNAAFARVLLDPLQTQAQRLLADFSLGAGNTTDTVKRLTVRTYDYDEGGAAVEREVELPIAVAMELVAVSASQYSSYNEASAVAEQPLTNDQLYRTNPDGSLTRIQRGATYYDPEADRSEYITISRADYEALKDRFETGNGGYEGEQEAYKALTTYFNNKAVVDLLEQETALVRPDEPFERVEFYYPIRNFSTTIDPKQQSRGFSRTLEESRQLVARQEASQAVIIGDPVGTMAQYQNAISDVLEYTRLVDNLNSTIKAISETYQGPGKQEMLEYLNRRRDEFQSYNKMRADDNRQHYYQRAFKTFLGRTVKSIFSFNPSIILKQVGGYSASFGQGIIADEHLSNPETLGLLTKLTGAALTEWTTPGSIIDGDEDEYGLKSTVTGNDATERPYVDELLGNTDEFPDELSKQRQMKRFATLLDRVLNTDVTFASSPSFADLGLNQDTLNQRQKMIAQYDQFIDQFGMAGIRKNDRAVILSLVAAAKLQATEEGLKANTEPWWGRVADLSTEVMYKTNVMNQLSEKSPAQTSFSFLNKMLGLFAGQSFTIGNLVMSAMTGWTKTESGTEESNQALIKLGKTVGYGVMVNALYTAIAGVLASTFMTILGGDEPKSLDENMERIGYDFLRNVTGTFPSFGSAAIDFLISEQQGYRNNDLLGMPGIDGLQTGLKAIEHAGAVFMEEDEAKKDKLIDSTIYETTDFLTKLSGFPSSATKLMREWSEQDV